jgi:hypothetical protein
LEPITLHEARHTFASLMIAAGVNAKALATYMGHSSMAITYDRYGHLMPGNEDEAAALARCLPRASELASPARDSQRRLIALRSLSLANPVKTSRSVRHSFASNDQVGYPPSPTLRLVSPDGCCCRAERR